MAETAKTKKPTGLTLKRKANKFKATWKIADKNYGAGQTMQIKRGGGWEKISVGKKDKSKEFTVSASDFYPNTKTVKGKTVNKKKLKTVSFRVKGTRKNYTKKVKGNDVTVKMTESDWSKKEIKISAPKVPKLTVSAGTWPQASFKWSVPDSGNTDLTWFTQVRYQSVLKKDSNVSTKNGADINWKNTVTGSTRYDTTNANASQMIPILEDSDILADGASYTRWFRARAEGPAGHSEWAYAKYIYANPLEPSITDYYVKVLQNKMTVTVTYDSPKQTSRPIKELEIQWKIETPGPNMSCPATENWTTAKTAKAKNETGGVPFEIDQTLNVDECLFLRVVATYADEVTRGAPVMAQAGSLTAPTITSITTDGDAFTADVTATNDSSVTDSFLVVRYYSEEDPDGFDIAIIPAGQTTVSGIQCPAWTSAPRFGVYAAVGSYVVTTRADGIDQYEVDAQMTSAVQTRGGAIPAAPENVDVNPTRIPGTVRVTWDWSWAEADSAELSWADHDDAWESTEEPNTYTITKLHAGAWNISGLETGVTWYVRVRLLTTIGDSVSYGAYSEIKKIDLSSAPLAPMLTLSSGVVTEDGEITASWSYSTTDGTKQAHATLAVVTYEDDEAVYTPIAETETAQSVTITSEDFEEGWTSGQSYALAVITTSASNRQSDAWSDPQSFVVAEPPTCTITETSLGTATVTTTDEEGTTVTETVTALQDMPLTVTVTGAGDTDVTRVVIERAAAYHVDRPDETDFNGFEGETIAIAEHTGDAPFAFTNDDLIVDHFDDGAAYRIIATVQDGLGQSAEDSVEFEVVWAEQATEPSATVTMDGTAAFLTPIANAEGNEDDVCDIYRLSVDRPQLIYEGATFGETYVDPFPTIGQYGGHRFVTRTANGDYIMDDPETGDSLAWHDTGEEDGDTLDVRYNLIDFAGGQVELTYNVGISNAWKKDFKETTYLGGSIQGDWNKAVSRTSTVSVTARADLDQELIQTMRRLADYPGICHVRTKDGSSYPADVQVSETYNYAEGIRTNEYQLSITRIDPEELDGMTLSEWQDIHEESE